VEDSDGSSEDQKTDRNVHIKDYSVGHGGNTPVILTLGKIVSLRPTWAIQQVPGESGLHSKTLSQKKQRRHTTVTTTTKRTVLVRLKIVTRTLLGIELQATYVTFWQRTCLHFVLALQLCEAEF
jgi:hypothetical protein